jgi:hypothetical protein
VTPFHFLFIYDLLENRSSFFLIHLYFVETCTGIKTDNLTIQVCVFENATHKVGVLGWLTNASIGKGLTAKHSLGICLSHLLANNCHIRI